MTDTPTAMERRQIICPETSKPEEIDLERTPCGVVIGGCSRFEAIGEVCSRACAVRLDERDRCGVDHVGLRVLVVYTGQHISTKAIALSLAEHLSRDGLTAELADADSPSIPPLADFDAVVIGSSVRFGRHPHSVIDYVVHVRDKLATMPAFFFSIGNHDDIDRMCQATGWRPTSSAVFERRAPDRRRFLHILGGRAPSAKEFAVTESNRVRAFASAIGDAVPTPASIQQLSRHAADQGNDIPKR